MMPSRLQVSSESELIFVADNLAYFDYQQQDEPLFVMHQIDVIVSVSGSHVLDSFHQVVALITSPFTPVLFFK